MEPPVSSQFQLIRERRYCPFFGTAFLGAFNDNVLKTALVTLVTFRAGQLTTMDPRTLATLLPGLFIRRRKRPSRARGRCRSRDRTNGGGPPPEPHFASSNFVRRDLLFRHH